MANWTYDREMGWHTAPVDESEQTFVMVYKSAGGDYAITAMREGDAAGGDVAYEPTLPKAKQFAEQLIESGNYIEYLLAE